MTAVVLDPDVAAAFPTSASVNRALRALLSEPAPSAEADTRPPRDPRSRRPARRESN